MKKRVRYGTRLFTYFFITVALVVIFSVEIMSVTDKINKLNDNAVVFIMDTKGQLVTGKNNSVPISFVIFISLLCFAVGVFASTLLKKRDNSPISSIVDIVKNDRQNDDGDINDDSKYIGSRDKDIFNSIYSYINVNHTSPDICLEKLSEDLHFCVSYLSKLFKENAGISIKEYITSKRLETAKILLLTTELKVKDIQEKVGYLNDRSFFINFKMVYGETPNEYRNRHVKMKEKTGRSPA